MEVLGARLLGALLAALLAALVRELPCGRSGGELFAFSQKVIVSIV